MSPEPRPQDDAATDPPADPPAGRLADRSRPVRVQDRRQMFQGAVWEVTRDTFILDDGEPETDPATLTREYIEHPGAVAVLALDEQDRIRMIRQYRHPVGRELWEIPAGLLDEPGEDPLVAARRELAEEVDLTAIRWDVVTDFYTTPGSSTEGIRIFLARDLTPVPEAERHERTGEEADMATAWVPVTEAVDAVLAGRVHNASACLAVLALQAHAVTGYTRLRPADSPWTGSDGRA